MSDIIEINKDTFWTLINQGREQCGQDVHVLAQWLEDRLMELGPKQALNFDYIAHAYRAAAYKYGLWNVASIMCDGCTDDGFTDFRGWLIAQGRDVYMAALKNPDSLADVPTDRDCYCETLCYVGSYAYEELTGRDINQDFDPDISRALAEQIKLDREIIHREAGAYVRRLLSAITESGLDARAMPATFLGGGAALLKRHVSATDGLCRPVILDDICLNAKGYERLVGQLSRAAHTAGGGDFGGTAL